MARESVQPRSNPEACRICSASAALTLCVRLNSPDEATTMCFVSQGAHMAPPQHPPRCSGVTDAPASLSHPPPPPPAPSPRPAPRRPRTAQTPSKPRRRTPRRATAATPQLRNGGRRCTRRQAGGSALQGLAAPRRIPQGCGAASACESGTPTHRQRPRPRTKTLTSVATKEPRARAPLQEVAVAAAVPSPRTGSSPCCLSRLPSPPPLTPCRARRGRRRRHGARRAAAEGQPRRARADPSQQRSLAQRSLAQAPRPPRRGASRRVASKCAPPPAARGATHRRARPRRLRRRRCRRARSTRAAGRRPGRRPRSRPSLPAAGGGVSQRPRSGREGKREKGKGAGPLLGGAALRAASGYICELWRAPALLAVAQAAENAERRDGNSFPSGRKVVT